MLVRILNLDDNIIENLDKAAFGRLLVVSGSFFPILKGWMFSFEERRLLLKLGPPLRRLTDK